ncbi:hypothetical protein, partial [Psychrobacter sp. I-STPA6b]
TEFIVSSVEADQLYAPIENATATETPENSSNTVQTKSALDSVVPLSILDTAAEMLGVGLGDRVHFNIQGIEITGQITSIRQRYERGPSPYFYFLFEPSV